MTYESVFDQINKSKLSDEHVNKILDVLDIFRKCKIIAPDLLEFGDKHGNPTLFMDWNKAGATVEFHKIFVRLSNDKPFFVTKGDKPEEVYSMVYSYAHFDSMRNDVIIKVTRLPLR